MYTFKIDRSKRVMSLGYHELLKPFPMIFEAYVADDFRKHCAKGGIAHYFSFNCAIMFSNVVCCRGLSKRMYAGKG